MRWFGWVEFWYSISKPVKIHEHDVELNFIKTPRKVCEQMCKHVSLFLACVRYHMEISIEEEQTHLRTISMRSKDIAVLRKFSNSVNLNIVKKLHCISL